MATLPGAADPREAQAEPRTRPSQSKPRPGGSILAPARPLRDNDDKLGQAGRAAPAASLGWAAPADRARQPQPPGAQARALARARVRLREIRATEGGAAAPGRGRPRPGAPPTVRQGAPPQQEGSFASLSRRLWFEFASTFLNQRFPASLPLLLLCFLLGALPFPHLSTKFTSSLQTGPKAILLQ